MPRLDAKGVAALDALLASAPPPATHFGATTATEELYFACKGDRVLGHPEKGSVDADTTLQLFSMTKLVTSVAVLQLIDRGVLSLDDPALIEKHLPELCKQEILRFATDAEDEKPTYTPRKTPLTLRHLLTHTAGLGYFFNSPEIMRWDAQSGRPAGTSIWAGTVEGYTQPLLFEPGTAWKYGVGIDWAGILVQRASGQPLDAYFSEHIFAPLGIKTITFHPTADVQARMQQVCSRDETGAPIHTTSIRPEPFPTHTPGQLSGGGGLFGTARDYLRFLRGVLASDPANTSAAGEPKILSPQGFKTLFTNALPPRGSGNTCYADLAAMTTRQTYHDPDHTVNDGQFLEHSVGLVLNTRDSVHGRKAGSGCWDGAAKTQYWIDPAVGVAGIAFTQLLTPHPEPFMRVYNKFERTLYDHLEA